MYWEPGFGLSMSYDLAEQLIVLFLLVGISRFLHGRLPSTGRSREDTTAVVLYISGLLWQLISLARALSRLAEPQTYSVGYFLFNLFYPIAMMIAVIMITAALIRRSHQVKYRTSSWAVVKSSFLFFPLFGILKYWIVIFIFWKIFDNWERLVELDEILNF